MKPQSTNTSPLIVGNVRRHSTNPATVQYSGLRDFVSFMQRNFKTTLRRYFGGRTGAGVNPVSRYAVVRPIAMSLIVTTLTMGLAPAVQAAQAKSRSEMQFAGSAAARYGDLIRDLKEKHQNPQFASGRLTGMASSGVKRGVFGAASDSLKSGLKAIGVSRGDYTDLIDQITVEHEALQRDAAAILARWRAAKVAPEFIAEQTKLDQLVATKNGELIAVLKAANASTNPNDAAQVALTNFLKSEISTDTHNKLNVKRLPWQSALAVPGALRAPMTDSGAFKRYLNDRETQYIQNLRARAEKKGVALAPSLAASARAPSGTNDTLKARPISSAPSAADLEPTPDAPHSASIRDLAITQLGKNPVAIVKWVHDNIAFVPTYGSVQGAEDTLNKRSGNAFDQASLTIAMLRSAGIHARYVVGTIEVPEHKLRNWMGDFKTIDAAQQILAQGGIPNIAMVKAGRIASVRLEHAWVEAYVSMFPSRGAKHVGGVTVGDHWVPVDPSYKQHDFREGMNLKEYVSFDTQGFLNSAKEGAAVNEAEGWVQNLNQANIKSRLDAYQVAIRQQIDSNPNATVGDVLGTQSIIPDKNPFLAGVLKLPIVAVGERYSSLPNSLRAHFRYGLYSDRFSYTLDSPDFQYVVPTSEIAGKKITIAWVPASDASRQAIEALLPPPNPDGSPMRPDQLPQGLPASISLKAELRVEGELKVSSSAYRAGAEPVGAGAFTPYATLASGGGEWDETIDGLVAGQQTSVGVSVQGISKTQLDTLNTRMQATKGKLEFLQADPNNTSALAGLTGDNITGDILAANIWSWFADLQSHGRIASSQATIRTKSGTAANGFPNESLVTSGIYDMPALQYGLFHANAQPNKILNAVTTGISFRGVMMDIGHGRHLRWVKDTGLDVQASVNTNAMEAARIRWAAYNRLRGQYASALEHTIPERYFNDTTKCNAPTSIWNPSPQITPGNPACAEGISTTKAIAIAERDGQKIFTISQTNADYSIPQLVHRSSVIDEVRASVSAGKVVVIPERAVSVNGWVGAGYAVIDEETGGGAYLIEGGFRGGALDTVGSNSVLLSFTFFALGLLASAFAGGLVIALVAMVALVISLIAFAAAYLEAVEAAKCPEAIPCIKNVFLKTLQFAVCAALVGALPGVALIWGLAIGLNGLIWGDDFAKAVSAGCVVACPRQGP